MSAAAVMRCDTGSLKPTHARALSAKELSSHLMPDCGSRQWAQSAGTAETPGAQAMAADSMLAGTHCQQSWRRPERATARTHRRNGMKAVA